MISQEAVRRGYEYEETEEYVGMIRREGENKDKVRICWTIQKNQESIAVVRSFQIHPIFGVPDLEISEFLAECEKKAIINVTTQIIPANEEKKIDPRLTIIVTKLDDLPLNFSKANI